MGAMSIWKDAQDAERGHALVKEGFRLGSREYANEYEQRFGTLPPGETREQLKQRFEGPPSGDPTKAQGRSGPGQAPRPGARGPTGRVTGLDEADPELGGDERRRGKGSTLGGSPFRKTLLGE